MSCPHRCKPQCGLIIFFSTVKGNECVSYVNRGQAAACLKCCMKSNTLALAFVDGQPQCGFIFASWKMKGYHSAQGALLVLLQWADSLHKRQRGLLEPVRKESLPQRAWKICKASTPCPSVA